jgi:methionine-rich copper-binding protein CopC
VNARQFTRIAAVVMCLATAKIAVAHAHPKTEVPAADAVVSAPSEVSIVFDDALEPAFSTLSVSDIQGHAVSAAKADIDAATHKSMRLPLPALAPGVYQVNWVAVAVDGHRTKGSYRFTVK